MTGAAFGDRFTPYMSFSREDIKSIPELKGDTLIRIELPPGFRLDGPNTDERIYTTETDRQLYKCAKRADLCEEGTVFIFLKGRQELSCAATNIRARTCDILYQYIV